MKTSHRERKKEVFPSLKIISIFIHIDTYIQGGGGGREGGRASGWGWLLVSGEGRARGDEQKSKRLTVIISSP